MAKIICTLPNASELINDVKFAAHELGMISEEVADEVAEFFTSIPGYITEEAANIAASPNKADSVRVDLEARAAAVNLAVKKVWSNDRLQSEVEKAEKAAAQNQNPPAPTEVAGSDSK